MTRSGLEDQHQQQEPRESGSILYTVYLFCTYSVEITDQVGLVITWSILDHCAVLH